MNFHNITNVDMINGEGLRVVLWVSGCSHQCPGCHNLATWDDQSGILFDQKAKDELFGYLKETYISGLTLSGGDPLYPKNRQVIQQIIQEVKEQFPSKTIWMYTGFIWEELLEDEECSEIVTLVDVIVDGRFEMEKKSSRYPWAGSSNQRVIDVQKSLKIGEVVCYENH